jgi:hypothetical protein
MNETNILKKLKQHFDNIIPKTDIRTNISPFEFVICLVFRYLGDTKKTSLDAIRRNLKNLTKQNISRSSF